MDLARDFLKTLPPKQLIADRLVYSLEFAIKTIQHLIIDGHSAPENAEWFVRPEKIIAEAAFLMVFAKAGDSFPEVKEGMDKLYKLLEPLARSKTVLTNICLKPALALDYAHAHICLSYLGYSNSIFDKVLLDILKEEKKTERTPYRMLEQEWLLLLWKGSNNFEKNPFWEKYSSMNFELDIFSESSDGVYSLTHAIMYSFFAKDSSPVIDINKIIMEIESLLIIYMDKQDYDIVGELLLAWALTQKPYSPIALFALDCIIRIEKRVDFLPAPNLDMAMIEGKELNERRTYIYSINYHTAFVMGLLLGGLIKSYESYNPHFDPDKSCKNHDLKRILHSEIVKEKQAHWMEFFGLLDNENKEKLFPWVFQAFLFRKIRQHEYGLVKKLIDRSEDCGLSKTMMVKQAKELLNRLAMIA